VLKNNDEHLYNQYYEMLSKMTNDLKVNVKKSNKQNNNWIGDDKIAEIYGNLQKAIIGNKSKSKKSYEALLKYMILSLYVLIPPRRNLDYVLLVISNDMTD